MSQRKGFALLYAVFMIMALSLIALGVMATGVRESTIAGILERHGRARARAEGAALETVARWSTRSHSVHAVGSDRALPLSSEWTGAGVRVARLDATLYLITSEARDPLTTGDAATLTPAVRVRVGLLVRTLDPAAVKVGLPAALAATGEIELVGGRVAGESTCADTFIPAPGPAAFAPEVMIGAGAKVTGDPAVYEFVPPAPAEPDPFSAELSPGFADLVHHASAVVPRPLTTSGRCSRDPANWGAIDPDHPCHGLLPFIHATGSLRVVGGQGRGVLVIDGDARFTDGARFEGIVVVRGQLILDGESRIHGAVRAASARIVTGEVRRNDCALAAALAAPALDRAFRPPGRWWIPVFQGP